MSNESFSPPPAASQPPLTESEERQWAMFAHLGVLVNLVSGFLGPLVPLIIYMLYKELHAMWHINHSRRLFFNWSGGSAAEFSPALHGQSQAR